MMYDTKIWLQVFNYVIKYGQDYYVGFVYLHPNSSYYYKMYEYDIFFELFSCVERYSTKSSIIIFEVIIMQERQ